MRGTSLEAYYSVKITKREQDVIAKLSAYGDLTNYEIAKYLGWEINRVTGRTNGLVKKGVVGTRGRKKMHGRNHTIWGLNNPEDKQERFF